MPPHSKDTKFWQSNLTVNGFKQAYNAWRLNLEKDISELRIGKQMLL